MTFTENDLINALKANASNGRTDFLGKPEVIAQFLIDYMKEHKEYISEEKLDDLANEYANKNFATFRLDNGLILSSYSENYISFKAGYLKALEEE